MLLAARALRCAEVVALQMTDLNLDEGIGKGQREATWVTIPPNAVEALRAWLAYRGLWLGPMFIPLDLPGRETPLLSIHEQVDSAGYGSSRSARRWRAFRAQE
ncbi:MAG: hypothetical protein L6R48_26080, partial [Planctomycetes bacterium]|nr:hypothetical protein [Planctomycetota bacterium]